MKKPRHAVTASLPASVRICALFLLCALPVTAKELPQATASTWPQPYSIQRDDVNQALTLRTPYYAIKQDLKRGGAISSIRLTYGRAQNLLVSPFDTRVQDAAGEVYSDLNDPAPRVTARQDDSNAVVTVEAKLRGGQGWQSSIRIEATYDYRWGYVKIHKQITFPSDFRAKEICPVSTVLAPSLSAYGYRDGRMEQEGAPPFSFNTCHWGKVAPDGAAAIDTPYIPRYAMFVDPGREGLEWFVSDDLAEWDLQVSGKRGQGRSVLRASATPAGIAFAVSPYENEQSAVRVPAVLTYDYYIGLPLLEGHAFKPWLHASFNRNRGEWVSAEQIRRWAASGIQTVHCHNDGDYYGDGLFWRDGSYPPYPDMDKYDAVINDCHKAGILVGTYFSNKELHPSTAAFKEHGMEWGRMDRKGDLQHNIYRGKSEFGAQMCLRSGWLDYLKFCVDRVLTHNPLDGVYYDWNVALVCYNPRHEHLKPGQPAAGHWDIDELLNLMEWTRRRVGPHGLVIVHDTMTPMFATENFANYVVANEWGYGKWPAKGPNLDQLPLEWSLVNARPRGVISYGQIDANAPRSLFRLFALEALLAGVTPWPASPETFDLYKVLKPIGSLETCRFADWRNRAVIVSGGRCGSAIYSRPGESWLLLGNLDETAREIHCLLHPDKLPYPISSVASAALFPSDEVSADAGEKSKTPLPLDAVHLTTSGLSVNVPPHSAVLLRVR